MIDFVSTERPTTTSNFDRNQGIIDRYETLRSLNQDQDQDQDLNTRGNRLDAMGEHQLAEETWAAAAKIHARRTEAHPGYIRAKNAREALARTKAGGHHE